MQGLFKNIIWLVALILLVGMTFIFKPGSENFMGALESTNRVLLTDIPGIVSRIYVTSGMQVSKGQILIELNDINLDISINETDHLLKRLKLERHLAYGMSEKKDQAYESPIDIQIDQLELDLKFKKDKKLGLKISALHDGIIGSINVLEGQQVAAFEALGDIYSTHPRMIHGFLHDSIVLDLVVGEQVSVQSANNPMKTAKAQVVAIGRRYIEFPIRLKTSSNEPNVWGLEVDILMPENHGFLPSEKVSITTESGHLNFVKKDFSVAKEAKSP